MHCLLVQDLDEIVINYPSMFELMHDLKGWYSHLRYRHVWSGSCVLYAENKLAYKGALDSDEYEAGYLVVLGNQL